MKAATFQPYDASEIRTWSIVSVSFLGFHLLYQLLRKSQGAFPFSPPLRLSHRDKVDWTGRVVSTINAVGQVVGALLAMQESRAYSDEDCVFGYGFYPATFASVFMGYLIYDTTFCLYYYKLLKDWPSLVHHVIYLVVSGYVLYHAFFKFAFVWLMMGEMSTPCVNLRWFLAVLDMKSTQLYAWNGNLMAVLFFVFRVVVFGVGLVHLFGLRELWMAEDVPYGLRIVFGLLVGAYGLNLYWFNLVLKGVLKLRGKKQ